MDVQVWILSGVAGILTIIVWWSVKRVLNKMDELITEVRTLRETDIRHGDKIESLQKDVDTHNERLNAHSDKITNLELNQVKCKNFKI